VTGVSGIPAIIQGRHGTKGSFELVVPLAGGGLGHLFRNNDNENEVKNNLWGGIFPFGAAEGRIDAVSLIQSNFSRIKAETGRDGPGNLELVARLGDRLVLFVREDGVPPDFKPGPWQGPIPVSAER